MPTRTAYPARRLPEADPSMQPCGKHRRSQTLALKDRRADGGGQADGRDG
jgi:hypothetical protein